MKGILLLLSRACRRKALGRACCSWNPLFILHYPRLPLPLPPCSRLLLSNTDDREGGPRFQPRGRSKKPAKKRVLELEGWMIFENRIQQNPTVSALGYFVHRRIASKHQSKREYVICSVQYNAGLYVQHGTVSYARSPLSFSVVLPGHFLDSVRKGHAHTGATTSAG